MAPDGAQYIFEETLASSIDTDLVPSLSVKSFSSGSFSRRPFNIPAASDFFSSLYKSLKSTEAVESPAFPPSSPFKAYAYLCDIKTYAVAA